MRFQITLDEDESKAMDKVCYDELRDPRILARLWIREELIRRGLLPAITRAPTPGPAKEGEKA